MENISRILSVMTLHLKEYELEGVELTEEDAKIVMQYTKEGMSENEAICLVLEGIRSVLD